MPSPMSTIGFSDYSGSIEGQIIETEHGAYVQWSPGAGAELWVQIAPDGKMMGLNPHFVGNARMHVVLTQRIARPEGDPLDGAFHGWANGSTAEPESGDYPFVFDVPDYDRHSALVLPVAVNVQLSAFAYELDIYESDEAYLAVQTAEVKFAPESFLPVGLFASASDPNLPPPAQAIFSGYVLETAERSNPATGEAFYWARVRTLGGDIDVVADSALVTRPIMVGGVVSGSFWLSGRVEPGVHSEARLPRDDGSRGTFSVSGRAAPVR